MHPNEVLTVLRRISGVKALVLGDLMLDRSISGEVDRVSSEVPVQILRKRNRRLDLGGAARVAAFLRDLDVEVGVIGVVGKDRPGYKLQGKLSSRNVEVGGVTVERRRPTTVKERFVAWVRGGRGQQLLRVDTESCAPIHPCTERRLKDRVAERINNVDVVVIADYGKGLCTDSLVRFTLARARALNIPLIVDPSPNGDWSRYEQVTCLKPNRREAVRFAGGILNSTSDGITIAKRLATDLDIPYIAITLDEDGLVFAAPTETGHFQALRQAPTDVNGAGDMALAMMSAALARASPWHVACYLANFAAGLKITDFATAPLSVSGIEKEIVSRGGGPPCKLRTLEEMKAIRELYRKQGRHLVLTNGCFDLLHVGHIRMLEEASTMGDIVVVAVNSDASVRRLKGPTRPVILEHDRVAVLAALSYVHHVVLFDGDTPDDVLEVIRPDVLVKGGTTSQIIGQDFVESYGGRVYVTARYGESTSRIIDRVGRLESIGVG